MAFAEELYCRRPQIARAGSARRGSSSPVLSPVKEPEAVRAKSPERNPGTSRLRELARKLREEQAGPRDPPPRQSAQARRQEPEGRNPTRRKPARARRRQREPEEHEPKEPSRASRGAESRSRAFLPQERPMERPQRRYLRSKWVALRHIRSTSNPAGGEDLPGRATPRAAAQSAETAVEDLPPGPVDRPRNPADESFRPPISARRETRKCLFF